MGYGNPLSSTITEDVIEDNFPALIKRGLNEPMTRVEFHKLITPINKFLVVFGGFATNSYIMLTPDKDTWYLDVAHFFPSTLPKISPVVIQGSRKGTPASEDAKVVIPFIIRAAPPHLPERPEIATSQHELRQYGHHEPLDVATLVTLFPAISKGSRKGTWVWNREGAPAYYLIGMMRSHTPSHKSSPVMTHQVVPALS